MVVIREPRTFYFNFDFPKDVGKNLKHEIGLIIKSNESLAQNNKEKKIEQFLSRYKHKKIFMNTENSKTNKLHEFVLSLSQRLERHSNKNFALRNFPMNYTWSNVGQQQENYKLRIKAPT